jgi:hypothetical protein
LKEIFRAVLVVTFCVVSTLASAQALWEGARLGMSPDEVGQTIRGAKPERGGRLANGAQELLRVDDYSFAGKSFVVSFFFLGGGLTQVMLSSEPYESQNKDNLQLFETVSALFRAKHGPEAGRKVENLSGGGLVADAGWSTGQTEISVVVSPITALTSTFKINYRAPVKR